MKPTPPLGSPAYCPHSLDHRHVWRAGDAKRNGVGGWDYVIVCSCCPTEWSVEAEVVTAPADALPPH